MIAGDLKRLPLRTFDAADSEPIDLRHLLARIVSQGEILASEREPHVLVARLTDRDLDEICTALGATEDDEPSVGGVVNGEFTEAEGADIDAGEDDGLDIEDDGLDREDDPAEREIDGLEDQMGTVSPPPTAAERSEILALQRRLGIARCHGIGHAQGAGR